VQKLLGEKDFYLVNPVSAWARYRRHERGEANLAAYQDIQITVDRVSFRLSGSVAAPSACLPPLLAPIASKEGAPGGTPYTRFSLASCATGTIPEHPLCLRRVRSSGTPSSSMSRSGQRAQCGERSTVVEIRDTGRPRAPGEAQVRSLGSTLPSFLGLLLLPALPHEARPSFTACTGSNLGPVLFLFLVSCRSGASWQELMKKARLRRQHVASYAMHLRAPEKRPHRE